VFSYKYVCQSILSSVIKLIKVKQQVFLFLQEEYIEIRLKVASILGVGNYFRPWAKIANFSRNFNRIPIQNAVQEKTQIERGNLASNANEMNFCE